MSKGLGMATLFNAPLLFLLWKTRQDRRAYREANEASLRELPLRPAGESLRRKIDALVDQQNDLLMGLATGVGVGSAICLAAPADTLFPTLAIGVAVIAATAILTIPKLLQIPRQLWAHRLGFVGEQLVAEELNQLMNCGYRVFHDVPCQGYNIDHVIVGPTGVFAIETKTHLRPGQLNKKVECHVRYDGDSLFWPREKESGPVDQALFNGRSLAHWLGSTTGEPVRVQPIVTIPGWSIEDSDEHRVWLLSPHRIKSHVEGLETDFIAPDQIQRITAMMAQRCRLERSPLAA